MGVQDVEAPTISRQYAHEGGKIVNPKHRPPLPPENIPGTHICYRIKSMKNSNDSTGTGTRDLPACRAVPQQTQHRVPLLKL